MFVLVFEGVRRCWTQTYMKEWIRSAGITKKITFHSYRRTFATLQAAAERTSAPYKA